MDAIKRLALGTVQFGLAYGVSHDGGRVPPAEAKAIVDLAAKNGVGTLDTAAAYGDSEEVLGDALDADAPFGIVTKTEPIRKPTIEAEDVDRIEAVFRRSLERLRRKKVEALLVHDARDILNPGGQRLWARLERLRDQGLAETLGVSAYDGDEIDATATKFPIGLVQAPVSVFDQRLIAGGSLARLKAKGVAFHARSVFLQGLLLMTPDEARAKLPRAAGALQVWREALNEAGVSPLAAALGFALTQPSIDRVVIGVHSARHLAECLAAARVTPALDYARFASDDPIVIDPRQWTK